MINQKKWIRRFYTWLMGSREYAGIGLLFFAIAVVMTDFTIFDINHKIFTTGIGDATSGFTWITYATHGLSFFTDNTTLINYPFGENLWSPIYITWLLILGPLWLLSRVLSPIAAGNVMLIAGFILTALVAYWALKKIVKTRPIAFIGAYAIAFVPYHVMKGADHLTNVYAWVFVAVIASFIAFWRLPSWRRAVLLALCIAASCYTDGYFIYVTTALLVGLYIAHVLVDMTWGRGFRQISYKTLRLVGAGVISLVLLLPIIWAQVAASKTIAADLSNARDDPRLEVTYYAARPLDFLLPQTGNVTASHFNWYEDLRDKKNNHSNDAESTNYIGYVVLALYFVGIFLFARYALLFRRSKKQMLDMPLEWQALGVTLIAAPLVLLWMLPPVSHVGPLKLIMPTYFMAEYLPYWRVPARVFLALHPLMVIAAMISLSFLLKNIKGRWLYIILAVVFIAIGLEYFSTLKHPSFSTYKMPMTYSWLRDQKDIGAIAEIPIVDRPIEVAGYYVFAQMIHGKPLVNTSLSKTAIGLYNPLGDIDNPETINFLKARGVSVVVAHEASCKQEGWGRLIHSESGTLPPPYTGSDRTSTCVYKFDNMTYPDDLFIFAKSGFSKTDFIDSSGEYWVAANTDELVVKPVSASGEPIYGKKARLLGTLGDFKKKPISWSIVQNGVVVASGLISNNPGEISAVINSSDQATIRLRLNDTEKPAPGEVGFLHMQLIQP